MRITPLWLVAGACLILAFTPFSFAQNPDKPRLITVSGESEVKVMPDQVVIVVGVETLDRSMEEAKRQNDRQVKDIADIAKGAGVKEGDIGTDFLAVDARYDEPYKQKKFVGYNVRRRIVITLNDISKFETLLSDLLSGGVEEIQNVQFLTTESRKYRDQARSMAIKAAREKAEALTTDLGVALGKPYSIEEKSSSWRSWYGGWGGWYRNSPNPFNSSVDMPPPLPANSESPMALGKISVTASVSVSFELQ